jgi:rfaE bifunctional protein kinase chain/domain
MKNYLSLVRLNEIVDNFSSLNVMVLGDYFLDKYLIIERTLSEISLETGLEAYQVVSIKTSPGAAGTVVNNLRALGTGVIVLGVIGNDGNGYELKRGLEKVGADNSFMVEDTGLYTSTYLKPMVHEPDGSIHEIERLDIKNRSPLSNNIGNKILENLRRSINLVDAVIVSEFLEVPGPGVVTETVRKELEDLSEIYPQKLFIADSRSSIGSFRNIIVKCNAEEIMKGTRTLHDQDISLSEIEVAGMEVVQNNKKPVFITLGERGMIVCEQKCCTHIPTFVESEPIDPVGAGDCVLAAISAALAGGASNLEAGIIASLAASVTIKKIGTTGTANIQEIVNQYTHCLIP